MTRTAPVPLLLLLTPACAVFTEVVRQEQHWDEPVFSEVSRAPAGLGLVVEHTAAGTYVAVVERFDCIEEATQLGREVEDSKPQSWVLGAGAITVGVGTSAAIGYLGGEIVNNAVRQTQAGRQSVEAQLVGTSIGLVGVGSQLLLMQKVIGWLGKISSTEQRPLKRELGRKVPCDGDEREGVLRGPGLPRDGVKLTPRARAPDGFEPGEGYTLDGEPVRVE
ncbi:MAG: hypothetical protein JNK82_05610 [Myxococcaceae bacterium]|nr:hypothetical protein [Myxococcaceae bacterium]